jgi:regulator of protease activity HflC (stomatin/prohibitin superfamily)
MDGFLIFLLVLVFAIIATLFSGVKIVPQGFQWTVERFGRYRATLFPGLNLTIPFIDRIGRKMNIQETVLQIDTQPVITKDNASVTVDGVVFYTILDAAKAAYEVQNLELAIKNITMTNIRTSIGSLDLDEALSKRDEINNRLLHVLDAATQPWGTKVTRVELKDIRPPEDVLSSMAKQLTAEREKRATVLQAEGIKQSSILKAEGEKQSNILAAEGRLAAANRDAEARERLAAAEAMATKTVSMAIEDGNVQALNYFIAQKYVDAFASIGKSSNSRLVFMPMEASALISTISGIAELAKGAAAQSAVPAPQGTVPRVPPTKET